MRRANGFGIGEKQLVIPLAHFRKDIFIKKQADVRGVWDFHVCASVVRGFLYFRLGDFAKLGRFVRASDDEGVLCQRWVVRKEDHLFREKFCGAHGRRRYRDNPGDRNAIARPDRNCAAHGMADEHGLLRNDGSAVDQFVNERFTAIAGAKRSEWARRVSMARRIRHKNAKILVRKILSDVRHDAAICGNAVKKYGVTLWRTRDWLNDINGHTAACGA